MANVCNCYFEITGPTNQIQDLGNKIKTQDPGLVGIGSPNETPRPIFYWFGESNNRRCYGLVDSPEDIFLEDQFIGLDLCTPWSPQHDDIIYLSKAYPDCLFRVRYEESGCEMYGISSYLNGILSEQVDMSQETYLDNYDEEYNEAVASIEDVDYESFLKNIHLIDTLEDDRYPGLVEKQYLKRLLDKHLPLLLAHKWLSKTNQDTFERRLKGEPKPLAKSAEWTE